MEEEEIIDLDAAEDFSSSWTDGLTEEDIDPLKKKQWLNDKVWNLNTYT